MRETYLRSLQEADNSCKTSTFSLRAVRHADPPDFYRVQNDFFNHSCIYFRIQVSVLAKVELGSDMLKDSMIRKLSVESAANLEQSQEMLQ